MMPTSKSVRVLRPTFLCVLLLLIAGPAIAEKTDEVVLSNGNLITCEVKSLQQGKVKASTDHADTIYIEWEYVNYLTAPAFFEVEDEDGVFYYGSLGAAANERRLVILGEEEAVVLDMETVVSIQPIKKNIWQRIDGSLDIGMTYTSADSSFQYSLDATATYRQPKYSESVNLSSMETRREGADDILRDSLDFNYTRYHTKRYFGTGSLAFTRNSELGINLRSELGYAFGRYMIITNRNRLSVRLGLSVSRDKPFGDGPTTTSGWGLVGMNYHFFLYNFPKTDILVDFSVQPGITDWPRTRANINVSLRREIITDFTVNLSVQDNYDSEPPEEASAKHDLAVILSVGWTF